MHVSSVAQQYNPYYIILRSMVQKMQLAPLEKKVVRNDKKCCYEGSSSVQW